MLSLRIAVCVLLFITTGFATEVQWPTVPDPLGLGPLSAVIDELHARHVVVPAGISDEDLVRLYNNEDVGISVVPATTGSTGGTVVNVPKQTTPVMARRLDPVPPKLQISWTRIRWDGEAIDAALPGSIGAVSLVWNGTKLHANEILVQASVVAFDIAGTSLLFNIHETNRVDVKGRIMMQVELTFADKSGRRVGHVVDAMLVPAGETLIGKDPTPAPPHTPGTAPVLAPVTAPIVAPAPASGPVTTAGTEPQSVHQEQIAPGLAATTGMSPMEWFRSQHPELFAAEKLAVTPVARRHGITLYLLRIPGDTGQFWLWWRRSGQDVSPPTSAIIDGRDYGPIAVPPNGEFIVPIQIQDHDPGTSIVLRDR